MDGQLLDEIAAGRRSVARDIGPSQQCGELPLVQLKAVFEKVVCPILPGRIIRNMTVIGCFFILREVELSLMLFSSVSSNMKDRLITIWLPATKTDPRALTCQLSWGCTCLGTDGDWLCPFHAGWDQHEQVKEHFGKDGVVPADVPFFPGRDGKALTKKQVVESVNCTAHAAGLDLRGADGSLIFTGHVFRITGPRHLARHHVPVPIIKLLARWQSDAV